MQWSRTGVKQLLAGCVVVAVALAGSPAAFTQPQSNDADQAETLYEKEREKEAYSLSRSGEMNVSVGEFEELELFLGLRTVGRAQALFQDDVVVAAPQEDDGESQLAQDRFVGFQTAWGNFRVLADYDERIEVFFDLYIASRPNPDITYGHEGFILVDQLPAWLDDTWLQSVFDYVSLKGGHFEIDFGDHRYRRSDNARVQRNPLIGNYVVDPKATEIGAELFADRRRFNWLVGVGSGTATENFEQGTGTSLWLKLWGYPTEWLRLSLSNYRVDHSENPPGFPAPDGAGSNLFSTHRSGGAYAGVAAGGHRPGGVLPGAGPARAGPPVGRNCTARTTGGVRSRRDPSGLRYHRFCRRRPYRPVALPRARTGLGRHRAMASGGALQRSLGDDAAGPRLQRKHRPPPGGRRR